MTDASLNACINCGRNEAEIPLTSWRLAGEIFLDLPGLSALSDPSAQRNHAEMEAGGVEDSAE